MANQPSISPGGGCGESGPAASANQSDDGTACSRRKAVCSALEMYSLQRVAAPSWNNHAQHLGPDCEPARQKAGDGITRVNLFGQFNPSAAPGAPAKLLGVGAPGDS